MKKIFVFFLVLAILFALIPTTYGKIKRIQSNDFLSDEIYSVIVVFDEPSVVEYKSSVSYKLLSIFFPSPEASYETRIENFHTNFTESVESLGAKVNFDFSYVLNGMSINATGYAIDKIITLPSVKAVYKDKTYTLLRENSRKVIGADLANQLKDANQNSITGLGIKVAVIDTGVDYTHKELGGGKFPNSKVIGGYDFANNLPDPMDYNGHGTHVAGIIAGSDLGIAKDAKIYAYKIFSNNRDSTSSSLIIKAIDQAVKDKCDVINISIGTPKGTSNSDDPESMAVRNAVSAGVVLVAAAGNAGVPSDLVSFPVSSPASVDVAIGVGASNDAETGVITVNGQKVLGQYPDESPAFTQGNYDVVYCGLGTKNDFASKNVKGKIALIDRGQIYFGDKDLNAKDAGAIGVIVCNNVSGIPKIALVSQDSPSRTDFIPFLFVSFTDGQILKWNIGTQFFISNEAGLGLMAEFSSAGPTSDFYFKPDLVAPGANINSTYLNNSYMKMSGTSMASPMIAGCAALIKQAKPTLSPQEIKYLMMNTADILYNHASNLPYSPTLQGAGRVNIFNAVNSTGLIYPAALIFGNGEVSKTFSVTLKNLSANPKTFNTSVLTASNASTSFNLPSSITLKGNSTTTFSITLTASDKDKDTYGFIFFNSGFERLHLPFVYLANLKPKEMLYNVYLDKNVVSQNQSITLNFSVGVGSTIDTENGSFKGSVAEEVKTEIFDISGNKVSEIFDVAPIYIGDYKVSITPFDALNNVYVLKNGTYFYKVSYIEVNENTKSSNVYPTIEKMTKSGSFTVANIPNVSLISVDMQNNYAPLLKQNTIFTVAINANSVKAFNSLSFNLNFDTSLLNITNVNTMQDNVSVKYDNSGTGASFAITTDTKSSNLTVLVTFKAIKNGEGFISISNPITSENDNFYAKNLYFEISDYSRIFDFNNDSRVDKLDLDTFSRTFGLKSGSSNFNSACDLNFDGIVDDADFFIFAKHYGEVYP